eukprot:6256043-Amphidinium_carterae.1
MPGFGSSPLLLDYWYLTVGSRHRHASAWVLPVPWQLDLSGWAHGQLWHECEACGTSKQTESQLRVGQSATTPSWTAVELLHEHNRNCSNKRENLEE